MERTHNPEHPAAGDPGGPGAAALAEERREYERLVGERQQESLSAYPIVYTRYMNMGYWRDGASTHDEAGERLALLVGEAAQLRPDEAVLDAGCGYAEHDLFWIGHFGVNRLTAIDIIPAFIDVARQRAENCGLSDRLQLQVASAVELPFEDASFGKVVSVESPIQFMTREAFVREAFRVLKPGGRLATADLVALPGKRVRHPAVNPLNMYTAEVYRRKLAAAGFTNVNLTSVREHVLKPFTDYMEQREKSRSLRAWLQRLHRRYITSRLDYLIVVADKPTA